MTAGFFFGGQDGFPINWFGKSSVKQCSSWWLAIGPWCVANADRCTNSKLRVVAKGQNGSKKKSNWSSLNVIDRFVLPLQIISIESLTDACEIKKSTKCSGKSGMLRRWDCTLRESSSSSLRLALFAASHSSITRGSRNSVLGEFTEEKIF